MLMRGAFRLAGVLALVALLAGQIPAIAQSDSDDAHLTVTITKVPLTPDGTAAGAITDLIVTFEDPDPAVDGIGIEAGGSIEIVLPDAFQSFGVDSRDGVFLLQGWPQSPPDLPFPWTVDIDGNTISVTLTGDYLPGMYGPGPKQVHLLLYSFRNPSRPGSYPIQLTIQPDPSADKTLSGVGHVRIYPSVLASAHAMALYSGPPGPPTPFFNPLYQTVNQGASARQVGLYLWRYGGDPFVGVSLEMTHRNHGLLKHHGRPVGHIWIDAPRGAWDYQLHAFNSEGGSQSEEVPAFLTDVPVGLLLIQFDPDPDVSGEYTIRIRLFGGMSQNLYVAVTSN